MFPKAAKYVVVNYGGFESAIVFDPTINHRVIAGNMEVVGAGFVTFEDGKIFSFGRSRSLKIDSRPEDAAALERLSNRLTPSDE